jgi:hypothetical protein
MAQIVPYLLGGLTAFLVMDVAAMSPPAQQSGAVSTISAPALLGTPASSVNRAAKSDRATVTRHSSNMVKPPLPVKTLQEHQARDRKPASPRQPKVPVGCEPSFSPVAAPSLAHHTGRCMARLESPWWVAVANG